MFDHQRILYEFEYKSRHNELLREAEKVRLANLARETMNPRTPIHRKALVSIGHRMVSWGQRLERFDHSPTILLGFENSDCSD